MRFRGQLSVEFLLVVSFLLSMAAVLLNVAETQLRETEALDNAALSKAAADSFATLVNTVFLHGNGTQMRAELFIPSGSVCFFVNSTNRSNMFLECDPDPLYSGKVASRPIYTSNVSLDSTCPPASTSGGWYKFTVKNSKNSVLVNCSRVV